MPQLKPLTHDSDLAWFIEVPKCQELTQPQFHFGERVKWTQDAINTPRPLSLTRTNLDRTLTL